MIIYELTLTLLHQQGEPGRDGQPGLPVRTFFPIREMINLLEIND